LDWNYQDKCILEKEGRILEGEKKEEMMRPALRRCKINANKRKKCLESMGFYFM
jgi:hypothetical protein